MNQESTRVVEKHSVLLRICHWLNVPLLLLMIWSGILIYWADQAFLKLPDALIETFHINHRLAEGMGWHFFIMWPFVFNGFFYLFYLLRSGFRLNREKYSYYQRFAYAVVLFMSMGSLITGIAIYKPVQLGFVVKLLGGYETVREEHFYLMFGFICFIIIHVVQVLRSGWNTLRGMIAGYELEE